ncbi:putative cytochrome P450 alkane hydroxylase [Westerdykella ornata]|uniref:Putative cytochrome P450 alkane hydroxylase n=1 Tax=Westerdykella ornata TaxID=318751 RepID=A0A6A6J5B0_WESOR|nr:putative cytochrome P450 alkane hydroxylase [Westerdykella ornata]KAF2271625.1 putative cytochrome P450 alkane hydroxylase [Westerdykella ornata]
MARSPILLFAIAGVVLLLVRNLSTRIYYARLARRHGCKPAKPLPQGERILGFSLFKEQMKAAKEARLLPLMVQRHRDHGNTFKGAIMGREFITTIEPENIKAILSTNFKDYKLGREDALGPLLGKGIFTSDGARWEHSRALLRPSFTRDQISDLDLLETHVLHLLALIPTDGTTVDLQPLFFRLTMDSATQFLFGESVCSLLDTEHKAGNAFATQFNFAQSEVVKRYRLGPMRRFYRNKQFDEACDFIRAFVGGFVDKALAYNATFKSIQDVEQNSSRGEKERYVFLQELAKQTNDKETLTDEILSILMAGRDTTACLLSNTFHALARHPEVWRKLKAEVALLEGRRPGYEELRQMKYLKYIMNESLRLYPVVAGNSRVAVRPTVLPVGGGPDGRSPILVHQNQPVSFFSYALHRRTDLFGPDAEEFKPERWETLRPGWTCTPFSGGPRVCLGQQFALTEAGYTIVRIVQMVGGRLESRDEHAWAEKMGLATCSFYGVKVGFVEE